jgi:hypothetical protein
MKLSGQLHAPGCFNPREKACSTHWIGGWVVSRAGLDMVVKRKIRSPCQDLNPESSPQSTAIPLSYLLKRIRNLSLASILLNFLNGVKMQSFIKKSYLLDFSKLETSNKN